jgi:hypothetical protein
MTDTPTPRTDAAVELAHTGCDHVEGEFARQLERELAVAMDALDECWNACNPAQDETSRYIYGALVDVFPTLKAMRRAYEEGK